MKHLEGLERVMPVQPPPSACPHAFSARQLGKPACSYNCRYCSAVLTMRPLLHSAPSQGGRYA